MKLLKLLFLGAKNVENFVILFTCTLLNINISHL